MKKCSRCKKIKRLNNFHKSQGFKDSHNNWCKICMSKYHKKYSKKFEVRKKALINGRKYFAKHRDKCLLRSRKWKQNNKNKVRQYRRQYNTKRKHTDIVYKMTYNLRSRVYSAFKHNIKSGSTLKLLDCSIKKLKTHLEKQFLKGMNWNNYGRNGWHIDHIKPCASFDLSKVSEQKQCFNYTNLRPLWEHENCSRNNQIRRIKWDK